MANTTGYWKWCTDQPESEFRPLDTVTGTAMRRERVEEIKWRRQIVYKWKEWKRKRHKLWQKWKWFRLPDTFPLTWSKLWTGHSKIVVNVLGLIILQLCQALVPFLERHGNLHTMSPTEMLNNKGFYCAQPTFPCWTRSLEFCQISLHLNCSSCFYKQVPDDKHVQGEGTINFE